MQFSLYQKHIMSKDLRIVSWSINRRLNKRWGKVFIWSLLMIKYCWFWFCLPACRERVFDWLIKNENWWPEFILNRRWGLSKDLHNFHQPNTFTGKSEVEIKQYHQDHYIRSKDLSNQGFHDSFSKSWEYLPAFCRLSHSIFCLEIESIDNFDKFHRKAQLKISQWVVRNFKWNLLVLGLDIGSGETPRIRG